jgi:hypothetical protein
MISSFTKITIIHLSWMLCANSLYALKDTALEDGVAMPAEKSLSGTINFFNGDSISGQLTDWHKGQVMITSPYFVDPISFSTAQILNITLKDNRDNTLATGINEDETTLVINNRDNQKGLNGIIKGGFSNIDDKHVTLKTSYAGEIKVLKKFVTRMEIDSKKGYLYLGPKSLDEWYNNSIKQTWEYTNNSLISGSKSGNIAQDLAIPEEAAISFDLSWKNDEYLTLYFFSSDHEQSKPDNYYQLNLQRGKCSVLKYTNGRQVSHLQSEVQRNRNNRFRIRPENNLSDNDDLHAHYEIYMSKTKGEFHIYRNGVKLDTFNDSNPQANKFGTALHIISSDKTPIRVKNLSLSKWSGNIPSEVDAETFAEVKGEGERILLKNGDILLGRIGKVRDGLMQIETLYTPLNIPIVRMRSIDLTAAKLKEEPIMYPEDIKCWFKDKGWIILKPISIKGNTLTAYHQALGENSYDLNVFKRIDLHIYDKNANASRKSDSW